MNTTPPTILADPNEEHRLPESNDPPTVTERGDLESALLGAYADDLNVIAAYRAGWDRGVNDCAEALTAKIESASGRVRAYLAAHDARYEGHEGAGGDSTATEVARLITTTGSHRLLIDDLRALVER